MSALTITHPYVSQIADVGDTSLVRPSDWNDDHTVVADATGTAGYYAVSAGPGQPPVWAALTVREQLAANRAYYVNGSTGSDTNNGLTPTTAFATIQHAIDIVAGLDISIYTVTVTVASGTYTESVLLKDPVGNGTCILTGDTTSISTWDDVLVTYGGTSPTDGVIKTNSSVKWVVRGVKLTSSGRGNLLYSTERGQIKYNQVIFGTVGDANADFHMLAQKGGRIERESGGLWAIAGAACSHYATTTTGEIFGQGGTCTIQSSGSVYNFLFGFAYASGQSRMDTFSETYTANSITGANYNVERQSTIFTNGGGLTYFPGSGVGIVDAATYALYI